MSAQEKSVGQVSAKLVCPSASESRMSFRLPRPHPPPSPRPASPALTVGHLPLPWQMPAQHPHHMVAKGRLRRQACGLPRPPVPQVDLNVAAQADVWPSSCLTPPPLCSPSLERPVQQKWVTYFSPPPTVSCLHSSGRTHALPSPLTPCPPPTHPGPGSC